VKVFESITVERVARHGIAAVEVVGEPSGNITTNPLAHVCEEAEKLDSERYPLGQGILKRD